MGACNFQSRGVGVTAREVFDRLTDDCRYENGHSYSGGIGMKTGFRMIPRDAKTYEKVQDQVDAVMNDDGSFVQDKWGDAGCIEDANVTPDGLKRFVFFGWASS